MNPKCPHCGNKLTPEQIASLLGSLGAGRKKTVSKAESKRRAQRLAEARKKRWSEHP